MPPFATPSRTSASMAARKAVRVLPEPVGAATRVASPAWIAGHARVCAAVGVSKRPRNHVATAGWKSASGVSMSGLDAGAGAVGVTAWI